MPQFATEVCGAYRAGSDDDLELPLADCWAALKRSMDHGWFSATAIDSDPAEHERRSSPPSPDLHAIIPGKLIALRGPSRLPASAHCEDTARGGDLLGPAGTEALSLERSVLQSQTTLTLPAGTVVGSIGWDDQRVNVVTQRSVTVHAFTAFGGVGARVAVFAQDGVVEPGTVVGWLDVGTGTQDRVPVTVAHRLDPLSIWQRVA